MKIIKRCFKIIIWTLLLLIFAYNIYTYISLNILKKDLVSINSYAVLELVSGSMEPTISTGDLIVINQNDKRYKKNDIITFKDKSGSFVTHRIIRIEEAGYVTKGDANDSEDEGFLKKNEIIGTYVFKISKLGYIIKSIKNPVSLVAIFLIGVIVCILISTDKEGKIIAVSEEEKRYFKEEKNKLKKIKKKKRKKISIKERIRKKIIKILRKILDKMEKET